MAAQPRAEQNAGSLVGEQNTLTQNQAVTLVRQVGKKIALTSTELVTLVAGKLSLKTITISSASLVTLGTIVARTIQKAITLSSAQAVTLVKSVGKNDPGPVRIAGHGAQGRWQAAGARRGLGGHPEPGKRRKPSAPLFSTAISQAVTLSRQIGHRVILSSASLVTLGLVKLVQGRLLQTAWRRPAPQRTLSKMIWDFAHLIEFSDEL